MTADVLLIGLLRKHALELAFGARAWEPALAEACADIFGETASPVRFRLGPGGQIPGTELGLIADGLPEFAAGWLAAPVTPADGSGLAPGLLLGRVGDEFVAVSLPTSSSGLSAQDVARIAVCQRVLAAALVIRAELEGTAAAARSAAVMGESLATAPRRAAPRDSSSPDGLPGTGYRPTRREQQVLTLVARGLTSGQIARRLLITERTVRKHLDSVYRNTGLPGRAAVAAWWAGQAPR